jgi:hypothetical protein
VQRTDQHTTQPTPTLNQAAGMYLAAAARYEDAAFDADMDGQYVRAASYRLYALQNREQAAACTPMVTTQPTRAQDDDPNGPWLPRIPGPRKPPASTR